MTNFGRVRFAIGLLALAALGFVVARPAFANPVTYTYTGNPFTTSTPNDANATSITGSLTLPSTLGDNFSGLVTPSSFSFDDGNGNLISSGDANITIDDFYFITNGSGVITAWSVELQIGTGGVLTIETTGSYDKSSVYQDYAENFNDPGTWSESAATPEPSSLLLLATGLLGLGPLIRRFAIG